MSKSKFKTAGTKRAAPAASQPAAALAAVAERVRTPIKEGNDMTNETINTAVETGKVAAERMQAAMGDAGARAQSAADKGSRMLEEATEMTKGNVEALVASSKIAARGVETLSREAADFSRRSFEEASATMRSFAEVKSPTDFFKLQGDYARTAFDRFVAESAKASEAMIKLAGEVAEPITSRYAVAADRAKASMAL